MTHDEKNYTHLLELSKKAELLTNASSLAMWDQETYMPKNGASHRAEILAYLAELHHGALTSRAFKEALSKLVNIETGVLKTTALKPAQKAAVREWRRDYQHSAKLPSSFVSDFAKLTSESSEVWKLARKDNDWNLFAPYLDKVFAMGRKRAEYLGYKDHPYDALIDEFEPETTVKDIERLFGPLAEEISKIRKEALKKKHPDTSFFKKRYDTAKQLELSALLVQSSGNTEEMSRIDETAHPFCSGMGPGDVRITTRIMPKNPVFNILASMHESGHALYDAQLPKKQFGSPLGQPCSFGIHESQSRWWECIIAQGLPFWKHYLPKMKKLFPRQLEGVSLQQFYKGINTLHPTPIRIDADEISYALHVVLRFEMERGLLDGTIKVKEVPELWNAKMKDYLGITVKNDAEGCLQDVHWSHGLIGYFPSYALGNLYSAQFFEAFAKAHPDWESRVAKGDFGFMCEWLGSNIHRHGRQYRPFELVKKVTGHALSPKAYLDYLKKKY